MIFSLFPGVWSESPGNWAKKGGGLRVQILGPWKIGFFHFYGDGSFLGPFLGDPWDLDPKVICTRDLGSDPGQNCPKRTILALVKFLIKNLINFLIIFDRGVGRLSALGPTDGSLRGGPDGPQQAPIDALGDTPTAELRVVFGWIWSWARTRSI